MLHWLLVLHWIRLPHWSAYFGWFVLCGYLGVYVPLFVSLSRQLVHRWRIPLIAAAPTVWCGLEFIRGYFATGFSMAILGHTQVDWLPIIQVADLGGAYLVSFLVMLVSAALAQAIVAWSNLTHSTNAIQRLNALWPIILAASLVAAAWLYGDFRVKKIDSAAKQLAANGDPLEGQVTVALIQGSRITTFSGKDDRAETIGQYQSLTNKAFQSNPDVDLVVWPESMLMVPWLDYSWPLKAPKSWPQDESELKRTLRYMRTNSENAASWIARNYGAQAIVGTEAYRLSGGPEQRFNRAIHVNHAGDVAATYDKMHPVMFGEYVPLGNLFPWLYKLTPMGTGLDSGEQPTSFQIKGLRISPCICYENTVPHLIRRQVNQLTESGQEPDAIVTITNDGWFWGSSQLDLHLACGIFRAVETRRPMLIAANTGISAHVAADGRVLSQGSRLKEQFLIARISAADIANSFYLRIGDLFAGGSSVVCLLGFVGICRNWRLAACRESGDAT